MNTFRKKTPALCAYQKVKIHTLISRGEKLIILIDLL